MVWQPQAFSNFSLFELNESPASVVLLGVSSRRSPEWTREVILSSRNHLLLGQVKGEFEIPWWLWVAYQSCRDRCEPTVGLYKCSNRPLDTVPVRWEQVTPICESTRQSSLQLKLKLLSSETERYRDTHPEAQDTYGYRYGIEKPSIGGLNGPSQDIHTTEDRDIRCKHFCFMVFCASDKTTRSMPRTRSAGGS